ncbi:MAG: hypothetical protein NZT92_12260 [Abditibacteriales bacterium]|nr:hypothetical protein [Abditibacteriales bacterium]MDW8366716.1 hypothetical protein [Abditibacteriales bacterium]
MCHFGFRFSPFVMGFGMYFDFDDFCEPFFGRRRFYTRQERIEHLKRIKEKLERELRGIEERIRDLEAQESGSR